MDILHTLQKLNFKMKFEYRNIVNYLRNGDTEILKKQFLKYLRYNIGYKKKTILQVLPSLISGGVEYEAVDVANYLANSGFNSFIVSNGGRMVNLLSKNVTHITLDVSTKNPIKILYNGIILANIIKKHGIDLLHVRSRAPAWSCLIANILTKIKFISTIHGAYNCGNAIKKFYNSGMIRCDKIIAISNFIKNYILENYKINEDKIVLINRGIDTDKFSLSKITTEKIEIFKKKYLVPKQTPIILLAARMTRLKGHIDLLDSLSKLNKNFYCLMVGDMKKRQDYCNEVKKEIEKLNLSDKVRMFDNEEDIVSLYSISDIVLSISNKPEAFGRTIIEAGAMEKIIIATNIGAAKDNIQNGINGYHVENKNKENLTKILDYSISILGTEEHKTIIENARKNVLQNFKLDNMLKETISLYDSLI